MAPRPCRPLAVVTGATSGFGRAAAEGLARQGFDLCLVCRDRRRAERVAGEIADASGVGVELALADLALLAEVERAAAEIHALGRPLRLLLNDAGAVFASRRETAEGHEQTFALNHLAYFQLTLRLLDRLQEGAPSRVVNVASDAYRSAGARFDFDDPEARRRYRPLRQYGLSKLANILFTHELARRLGRSGVRTLAWSPKGLTATRFGYGAHWLAPAVMKLLHPFSLSTGAAVGGLLALCTGELPPGYDGAFVCGDALQAVAPCNDADARRLWELSAQLTGVGA